jgi:FlaG/FlaF family flagellin (archaellin)
MRTERNHGFGRLIPVALTGLLALTVAACGGSAAAPIPRTVGTPATTDATTTPADPGLPSQVPATVTKLDIAKEAWFAGFHVTFGTATAEMKSNGGTVEIEATFENTGQDSARLDATISLVSAGETAQEGITNDIPSVPGGGTNKGLLAFYVKDTFSFDDAVLSLGQSAIQQAVIPLKGGADKAVSLEPVKVTVSGSGKAGDLQLDLAGGEYRADAPWKHGQQKKGTYVLTIDYSATFKADFAGGFAFTGENVALKLPDGSTTGAIQDGQSQSNELIGPNSTKKDLLSRFEIEDPAAGSYVLMVREGGATGEIPFTIG